MAGESRLARGRAVLAGAESGDAQDARHAAQDRVAGAPFEHSARPRKARETATAHVTGARVCRLSRRRAMAGGYETGGSRGWAHGLLCEDHEQPATRAPDATGHELAHCAANPGTRAQVWSAGAFSSSSSSGASYWNAAAGVRCCGSRTDNHARWRASSASSSDPAAQPACAVVSSLDCATPREGASAISAATRRPLDSCNILSSEVIPSRPGTPQRGATANCKHWRQSKVDCAASGAPTQDRKIPSGARGPWCFRPKNPHSAARPTAVPHFAN